MAAPIDDFQTPAFQAEVTIPRKVSTQERRQADPLRTRSAQLGWLTKLYSEIHDAVAKPNNVDAVGEAGGRLEKQFSLYHEAHYQCLRLPDIEEKKIKKLKKTGKLPKGMKCFDK